MKKKTHTRYINGYQLDTPSGFNYTHRRIAEEKIGRKLRRNEVVHHIDGNKLNNDPNNIEVLSSYKHQRAHKLGEKNPSVKLTDDQIVVCLEMHFTGVQRLEIAKKFNVSQDYLRQIFLGQYRSEAWALYRKKHGD